MPRRALFAILLMAAATFASVAETDRAPAAVSADSDPQAIEIAQRTIDRMGGWTAWSETRYIRWKFFGGRTHHWDRHTGDVRIEMSSDDGEWLWLMNVVRGDGRVWRDGEELRERTEALDRGRKIWVNDSYWLVMPFKLLDPGVTLRYSGQRPTEDGRDADLLELTFGEGVGYTPRNRYEVWVARDSGLVEQWAFYRDAGDADPAFVLPWTGWRRFGRIMLATDRGRGKDWEIAVPDDVPATVFRDPAPVASGGR